MNANKIKPEFVKKLDNYLLANFPAIWHTKIIWVAFYSLSLFGLFYFFGDRFDTEPDEYNSYYYESGDYAMFVGIPTFLTILMIFYWLYTQYQQKIDYSKLSLGGFFGIAVLNFLCVALIFLPVLGLAYSTLDTERNLMAAQVSIQGFLSMATFMAVLPFIIRQYKIIEIVLVIFFGFIYCLIIGGVFVDILREDATAVYVANLLVFAGYAAYKFSNKTFNQNTKRLALLCILILPVLFPTLLYYVGVYNSLGTAYIALAFREDLGFFGLRWLLGNIIAILFVYSVATRFMYQAMLFPMRKK